MNNGKKYTVQDTQSGKSVTFEWTHPQEPTDSDFEEVFKSAGLRDTGGQYIPGQMADTRSPSAQIPNEQRPIIPTPKTTAALYPFSTIGKKIGLPAAGAVVDAALPQVRTLANAVNTALTIPSSPNVETGILRGGQALGETVMAGLSAAHPLGFAQFGGLAEAASQISPEAKEILPKIFNPIQSLTNPQTQFGKELAKTGDVAGQVGLASLASRILSRPSINFEPNNLEVPKSDVMFTRGAERLGTKGGIRGQFKDIQTARADLSEAYKSGLNPDPNMTASQKLQEPLIRAKTELFNDELTAVNRHAQDRVNFPTNAAEKVLQLGKEVGNESKYDAVKNAISAGHGTLTLPEALQTLTDLNADLKTYDNFVNKTGAPPSPSFKANLSELKAIKKSLLNDYLQRMQDVGENGVRENRIRFGALDNLLSDIEAKKNQIDRQPMGFFERNIQKRPYSATSTIIDNLFGVLRKNPAEYVAKAARDWSQEGLTAPRITSNPNAPKGLLQSPAIQLPPSYPGGTSPPARVSPGFWQVGNKQLPPPSTRIAPEYMSQSQRYSASAPQMADVMQVKTGKFAPNHNAIRSVVESAGGKYKGLSDMGKNGLWVSFDEPTAGSTLAVPLNELSKEAVAAKIRGFAIKRGTPIPPKKK